jgi:fucose permease
MSIVNITHTGPMKTITQRTPLTRSLRLKIGLAFSAFILIGASDATMGVILPGMSAHYHVDKGTIGLLFICMSIGYILGSFNNGLLIDRLGNRVFLMCASGIFLLVAIMISIMPPFLLLAIVYLFLGLSIAMFDAGLNSYIAGLPDNTKLLNYLHAFYGAGALLGPAVASSLLALQRGWSSPYIVWGSMSLILLLGIAFLFKESAPQQQEKTATEGNILTTVLKLRIVWLTAIFLMVYVGTEISLGSWSYSFLTEERHGATLISGWTVSGYWFGLMLGRLLLGRVAQRIGDKRLIELCLVGVAISLLIIWTLPFPLASAFGLCLAGFSLGPIFPTTIALMSKLVSGRLLPTAIGFLASLGSMGGSLFPWLAGNLAQHIGLWSLLPYVIILTVVQACLWLILYKQPAVAFE